MVHLETKLNLIYFWAERTIRSACLQGSCNMTHAGGGTAQGYLDAWSFTMASSINIKNGLLATKNSLHKKIPYPTFIQRPTEIKCTRALTNSTGQHNEQYCIDNVR